MPIISSLITNRIDQPDGSALLWEQHTDHNGNTYDISYTLGAGLDAAVVLAGNAERLGARVDAEAQAEAIVTGYKLPLSPYQFLNRFTPAERISARALAKTDPVVEDILFMVQSAQGVHLTDPATAQGLAYLQSVGVLTAARAAEILNG